MLGLTARDDPAKWTGEQWSKWRDGQISQIFDPTFELADGKGLLRQDVVEKCGKAQSFLAPLLADPGFLKDPERSKALTNFVRFTSSLDRLNRQSSDSFQSNALGMDISDPEYFAEAGPYVQFPPLLKSQAFLKAMSDPATYRKATDMIAEENLRLPTSRRWVVFPFRAQFIPSVDGSTYGRMLVLVPNELLPDGRILDRWLMFAIATPDMVTPPDIRSVSLIATVRDPKKPGVSDGYFADYMRNPDSNSSDITLDPTFTVRPSPSKTCYDCHKTAVLPIHPKYGLKFTEDARIVRDNLASAIPLRVDEKIALYGKTNFRHLEPDSFGPPIGQSGRVRTDRFFADSTNVPSDSFPKLRAAMNCTSCHDGWFSVNSWLALRSDQEERSFESKQGLLQTYIEQGLMPPGNRLNPDERHALWQALTKEYCDLKTGKGTFVDWLRGG